MLTIYKVKNVSKFLCGILIVVLFAYYLVSMEYEGKEAYSYQSERDFQNCVISAIKAAAGGPNSECYIEDSNLSIIEFKYKFIGEKKFRNVPNDKYLVKNNIDSLFDVDSIIIIAKSKEYKKSEYHFDYKKESDWNYWIRTQVSQRYPQYGNSRL